jgi:hypothetical protein
MRTVSDLDREQLAEIVKSIQAFLYLDLDRQGTEDWNPDKQWSGADVCEHVAGLLGQHELVPERSQSADGAQYVLYHIDTERLVSADVYPSYPQAAEEAAGLDDVLILRLNVPSRQNPSSAGEPVTVRLQSEEFGTEDFQYDRLEDALQAVRRLYGECLKQDDRVQRQISLLVGPAEASDES